MPWKECHAVDERARFVARLLEGESMTTLCQEFGISRKTGYKIFQRYQQIGVRGLSDRSRFGVRLLEIQVSGWSSSVFAPMSDRMTAS